MTSSQRRIRMNSDLATQLTKIGLRATAERLDDFIARATTRRLAPRAMLERIAEVEMADRAARNHQRLLKQARIGRFKPLSDFDWEWPKKIDRELIERALTLDFISEARNLILLGANGLGKTMIAKNIIAAAVNAGYSAMFRTASDLLADLQCDSPQARRRKFSYYARPRIICIDEVGYLSYDSNAADLLYEIVNRRYERSSKAKVTEFARASWSRQPAAKRRRPIQRAQVIPSRRSVRRSPCKPTNPVISTLLSSSTSAC